MCKIYGWMIGLALMAGLAAAGAQAAPRPCTDADIADLPSPGMAYREGDFPLPPDVAKRLHAEDGIHALFDVPTLHYPYGSLNVYGFELEMVVNADGNVACATLKPGYRASEPIFNDVRKTFLDTVSTWRFEPYVVDGRATAVYELLPIIEDELPQAHGALPEGDPTQIVITQDIRPFIASYGPYHVELHGDGTAIYTAYGLDDPLGPQTYHVDPKAVQALIVKSQTADFWSLRDTYRSVNTFHNSTALSRLNITVGGVTKSVTDYSTMDAGMPQAVRDLQQAVMQAANVDFWQTPTVATIAQLKDNHYDFQSDGAGVLLLRMARSSGVKDDAVLAVIAQGAPQNASEYSHYADQYQDLLEATLGAGRTDIARQLIAGGALLSDGRLDNDKVNWAFIAAVRSGEVAEIDLLLPYHPDMTYRDPDNEKRKVSIIRRMSNGYLLPDHAMAMAQRLIDLGADVNASTSDGVTLLIASADQVEFSRFLVAHGARINVVDKDGSTPLGNTYDEDVALYLLEQGANPRLGKTARSLRFNIKNNHWTKVKTWLQGHGDSDVLMAQKEDH